MQYKIANSEHEVNELLSKGWSLHGSPAINNNALTQAMVKLGTESTTTNLVDFDTTNLEEFRAEIENLRNHVDARFSELSKPKEVDNTTASNTKGKNK